MIERLRPRLRTFQDEKGRELLDVPGGLFPDPETVAPPRFLPDFDNALLSHDDRTRILAKEHRRLVGRPTLLLDGYAVGSWKLKRDKSAVSIVIEMVKPLSKRDLKAVEGEGLQLLDFIAAGATTKEIRFVD